MIILPFGRRSEPILGPLGLRNPTKYAMIGRECVKQTYGVKNI